MPDDNATLVQQETDRLIFGEHYSLSYSVRADLADLSGGSKLFTDHREWYRSKKVSVVKGRWIYTFAAFAYGGLESWSLLQEHHVDDNGYYWRSDENDLFEDDPLSIKQKLRPMRHRREALETRMLAGGGDPYARLPYYVQGGRCSLFSVALAYPMPANRLDDFLGAARDLLLPWAVYWKSGKPIVNVVDSAEVVEYFEEDGATVSRSVTVDVVPTVDPLELAVRTNRVFQKEVKRFREIESSQTDKERFARELHQILSSSPAIYAEAKEHLVGGGLGVIESAYSDSDRRLAEAAAKFEARARVLTEFMRSRLFSAVMRAHRTDDESSGEDSERFVYFLYGLDAATDQLALSRSGHEYLERLARPGAFSGGGDPVGDYVFPPAPPGMPVWRNMKKSMSPILSLYGKLLPRLEISDAVLAHQLVREHLTRLTGHEFVALKRLPGLIPDGFFIEYHNPGELVPGQWISRSDLRQVHARAKAEAVKKIEGRPLHTGAQNVLSRVPLSLDIINLVLTEIDLEQRCANGSIKFRESYERFHTRLTVGIGIATMYAKAQLGEKAAAGLLKKLAIVGAIPSFNSSMMAFADSWESYGKGHYGKFAGKQIAGWAGLVATVSSLVPGGGWVALAAGLIATAGGMIADALTRSPIEQFFRFCEWGVGGTYKESQEKPSYSEKTFAKWKGKPLVQRAALSRILCSFSLEPVHEPSRRGVKISLNHFLPESMITIDWELLLHKGDGVPEERLSEKTQISGRALASNPRMIVYEPKELREAKGLRVDLTATVILDVRGDGAELIPKKGCKAILIGMTKTVGGQVGSLEVPE